MGVTMGRLIWAAILVLLTSCTAGPTGPQGEAGPKGDQGPAGPKGDQGNTGDVGPEGPMGMAGQSITGSSEPPGSNCLSGGVRLDSASGTTFVCNGVPGAVGDAGPQGLQGVAGPKGEQGDAGPTGPKGDPGDQFGEVAARFAGFTSTAYAGNQGSREQMNALCHQDFPGSHLCHVAEYNLSGATTLVPTTGAWIDPSAVIQFGDGSSTNYFRMRIVPHQGIAHRSAGIFAAESATLNCFNWAKAGSGETGTLLVPSNATTLNCTSPRPLACCSTPYRERFRGFTSAAVDGARGGRAGMNAVCATEFPGSHICHIAEYFRAHAHVSPPDGGAMLERSIYFRPGFDSTTPEPNRLWAISSYEYGGEEMGREIAPAWGESSNCNNWTSASTSIGPLRWPLTYGGSCAVPASVACCE